MARTAPAPDIPPIPGMCPSIAVLAGGGDGGGGSGGSAGDGDGSAGAGAETGGENAEADSRSALSGEADQGTVSHPVDVVTGRAFTLPIVDLALPGPLPLRFARTYASTAADRDVGLGPGWTHTLAWQVEVRRRAIVICTDDGVDITFPALTVGQEALGPAGWLLRREKWGFALDTGDGLWRLFSATMGTGTRERFLLTAVEDANKNRISLTYDDGRLVEIKDSAGRIVRVASTREGRIASLEVLNAAAQGRWVSFASFVYDDAGNLASVRDADGFASRYEYEERHLLTADTDRTGLTFHFVYDDKRRCVESWGDYPGRAEPSTAETPGLPTLLRDGVTRVKGVHHVKIGYHDGKYSEVSDSTQTRRFFGNRHGTLDKSVDAKGVTSRVYDADGYLLSRTDPLGAITSFERDTRGRVVRFTDPLGRCTTLSRDAAGLAIEVVDPIGAVTTAARDRFGNALAITNPTGGVTSYAYDGRGLVTEVVWPNGARSAIAYDGHGNPVSATQPNGAVTRWTYDFLGRRLSETNPVGETTRFAHSERGDLVAIFNAAGGTTRYTYDGEGHAVRLVDANGHATELVWGGYHRLCERKDARGEIVRLRYNHEGELLEIVNERGDVHRFEYSADRQVVSETAFDGSVARIRRDAASRVISIENALREKTTFVYNLAGELIERTLPDGAADTFEYNPRGELVLATGSAGSFAFERDLLGRIIREAQETGGEIHAVERAYDALGNVIARSSSLGLDERVERDALGARLKTWLGDHAIEHTRDLLGREVLRTLPSGGRIESAFEPLGRLARRRVTSPTLHRPVGRDEPEWLGRRDLGATVDTAYRYDLARELIGAWDASRGTTSYEYDPVGELLAVLPEKARSVVFRYDPAGNVSEVDAGACVYGPGNRLLRKGDTEYIWDAAGRLIEKRTRIPGKPDEEVTRYGWNGLDLLASVTSPDGTVVAFDYDPLARRMQKRVSKTAPGRTSPTVVASTRFVWDQDVLVHELKRDARAAGDPIVEEKTYCFEDQSFIPAAHLDARIDAAGRRESSWYHYVNDAVGAPDRLVGSDGSVACDLQRTPWGTTTVASGARTTTPLRFQGQYEDEETGLAYNRARYYEPGAGRYISRDPLGPAGGLNGFAYGKSPLSWIDPLGLASATVPGAEPPLTDVPGTFTLNAHGNSGAVRLPSGTTNDPAAIAAYIRAQPGYTPGMPVRLGACSTGAGTNSIAERLSTEMGVPVSAPDNTLWVRPDGGHRVSSGPAANPGTIGAWRTFP